MKILYAFLAVGNGHIGRATTIIPELKKHAEVTTMMSGNDYSLKPTFEINIKNRGLTLFFGKNGSADLWRTLTENNIFQLIKDVIQIDLKEYDLIVTDFELITRLAALLHGKKYISISNNGTILQKTFPKPRPLNIIEWFVLRLFSSKNHFIGIAYQKYNENNVTPMFSQDIKDLRNKTEEKQHILVYFPSYSVEHITECLKDIKHVDGKYVNFEVFSKYTDKELAPTKYLNIKPINRKEFLESLRTCRGIIANTGFQTTADCLFLNKKLLTIPMRNQIEQKCNAEALRSMGIKVIEKLDEHFQKEFLDWEINYKSIKVDYTDSTEEIVSLILRKIDTHSIKK